jgi:N-dimethylarginine dimethylaminohydrolase
VTSVNEYAPISTIALKHARNAFVDDESIDTQWQALNFAGPPDLPRAIAEYDTFARLLQDAGGQIVWLPSDPRTTLDSIYVRDASIVADRGVILCAMGKPQRTGEPDAQADAFKAAGIPVLGRIVPPGRVEGGDVIWLDASTLVIGRGYRTNDAGIEQLKAMLGPSVNVVPVPLPHWTGESDVMHLMSLISPIDADLSVVYSRLLPVPFRQWLVERGMRFVEVPDKEFESMGTNVLALAPRRCLVVRGNPRTRAAMERVGVEVLEYDGAEISAKGAGGPTCLTRPISRTS